MWKSKECLTNQSISLRRVSTAKTVFHLDILIYRYRQHCGSKVCDCCFAGEQGETTEHFVHSRKTYVLHKTLCVRQISAEYDRWTSSQPVALRDNLTPVFFNYHNWRSQLVRDDHTWVVIFKDVAISFIWSCGEGLEKKSSTFEVLRCNSNATKHIYVLDTEFKVIVQAQLRSSVNTADNGPNETFIDVIYSICYVLWPFDTLDRKNKLLMKMLSYMLRYQDMHVTQSNGDGFSGNSDVEHLSMDGAGVGFEDNGGSEEKVTTISNLST